MKLDGTRFKEQLSYQMHVLREDAKDLSLPESWIEVKGSENKPWIAQDFNIKSQSRCYRCTIGVIVGDDVIEFNDGFSKNCDVLH